MLYVAKRKATIPRSPSMSSLELFYDVDTFCQAFLPHWHHELRAHGQRTRQRTGVMTILIYCRELVELRSKVTGSVHGR